MKVVERISMGDRGRGTLLRFEGVRNWYVSTGNPSCSLRWIANNSFMCRAFR